jgi:hypothetical protein
VIAFGVVQTALRYQQYHLGIHGDMYGFLLEHKGLGPHTLLQPYNENLSAFTVLVYRAIFAFAGIADAVPYVVVQLFLMGACSVLAYVFARRELGPWIALVVPLVLMTLGPASELILAPEFSLFLGLALWLGAMLLIQRGQPLTDAIGCVLLILGIGSHSIVPTLLPATAVALVLWTPWRKAWRRAWIVVLPFVLYVGWHEAYHSSIERTLSTAPGYIVNSFVYTVEDLFGVRSTSSAGVIRSSPFGIALAVIVLVLICLRCLYLRRAPRTTIYMGVGLLTVWIAGGLNEHEAIGRLPGASRYQFANALLLMLALAPLVPRFRLTPLRCTLLAGAAVAIVASNFSAYSHWEEVFRYQEGVGNAQMAAVEVARGAIRYEEKVFTLRNDVGLYWPFTPKAYFAAIAAHGSPVRVDRDIQLASPRVRYQADRVLLREERMYFLTAARVGAVRPLGALGFRATLQPAGAGCALIPAGTASGGVEVVSPPSGLVIRPHAGPPVGVGAARFSEPPKAIELNPVPGGGQRELVPKHDQSSVPWRFRLTAKQAVTVCSGAA